MNQEQNQDNKLTIQDTLIIEDSDYLDLIVKQSQIKGAGDGLFCNKDFDENEIITEYRGRVIKSEYCNHELYRWEDKMVWVNEDYCIIGKNIASKVNDIVDFNLDYYNTPQYKQWVEKQKYPTLKNFDYNCQFDIVKNKVFLVATRDIQKGEELFVGYGFDYWKHFYDYLYLQKQQTNKE